jgi:hypothetical protein
MFTKPGRLRLMTRGAGGRALPRRASLRNVTSGGSRVLAAADCDARSCNRLAPLGDAFAAHSVDDSLAHARVVDRSG